MSYDNIKILEFLDLNCPDLELVDIKVIDSSLKVVTVQKKLVPTYCPLCQTRMHSKGFSPHKANHSILQDGYEVQVIAKARRWVCQNKECGHTMTDDFIFLDRYSHTTKTTDMSILHSLREWDRTVASVARQFNVSDTYVHELFDRYFDPQRLPLPEILSIDEVYINIPGFTNYALVLNDFKTGEPIDMVESRRDKVTETYFAGIPKEERDKVRYLITDMYAPYLGYVNKYFNKAVAIVDSFHVVSMLTNKLLLYMIKLGKSYKEKRLKENAERRMKHMPELPESVEEYMLKNYRWLVLKNLDSIKYYRKARYNYKLKRYMNTYDYEELLFKIAPELKDMRDLKEKYIRFNSSHLDDYEGAAKGLDSLIELYKTSEYEIFRDFAMTLKRYRNEIVNSFTTTLRTRNGKETKVRLSNGPIEGMNRFIKDMKRNSRGFHNYDHVRKRFLFARRSEENAPILGSPKAKEQIHCNTGIKRGPYKKK